MDGEQQAIAAVLEPPTLKALDDARMMVAKHSASYSARANALDAGNLFKASKTKQRHLASDDVELSARPLIARLDLALARSKPHWDVARRKGTARAIARVVLANQRVLTLGLVTEGFRRTGQFDGEGPNFEKKMSCTTYRFSAAELAVIRRELGPLTALMKAQGFVTEKQFDDAGVVSVPDRSAKPKDQRSFSRNRALLVNAEANLARYHANPPKPRPPKLSVEQKAAKAAERQQAAAAKAAATAAKQWEREQQEVLRYLAEEEKRERREKRAAAAARRIARQKASKKRKAAPSDGSSTPKRRMTSRGRTVTAPAMLSLE